jgi:hypothetical protein
MPKAAVAEAMPVIFRKLRLESVTGFVFLPSKLCGFSRPFSLEILLVFIVLPQTFRYRFSNEVIRKMKRIRMTGKEGKTLLWLCVLQGKAIRLFCSHRQANSSSHEKS